MDANSTWASLGLNCHRHGLNPLPLFSYLTNPKASQPQTKMPEPCFPGQKTGLCPEQPWEKLTREQSLAGKPLLTDSLVLSETRGLQLLTLQVRDQKRKPQKTLLWAVEPAPWTDGLPPGSPVPVQGNSNPRATAPSELVSKHQLNLAPMLVHL